MDVVSLTVGISWISVALLITGLAIPLVRGRVKRNPFYGVRFPQSLQSDDAWFAINRYGARWMIAWSVPLFVVGVAALFLPLRSHPIAALVVGLAPLVLVLIPVLRTYLYARRHWPRT